MKIHVPRIAPRNPYAPLANRRKAGSHVASRGSERQSQQRALHAELKQAFGLQRSGR
jgi:hypothetical protein